MKTLAIRESGDVGSVMLLILGLAVIAALFVTVVIDVSALFLDRRALIAAADGAALAGAQAVDERSLYLHGLPESGPLTLDEDGAREAVERYLVDTGVVGDYEDLTIRVVVTATTVRVELGATVELPVVNTVTPGSGHGVRVESVATAQSAVVN